MVEVLVIQSLNHQSVGKKKFNYGQVTTELSYEGQAVAVNVSGLNAVRLLTTKLATENGKI